MYAIKLSPDPDAWLKIEKMVPGGDGFARRADGKAMFVSGAYPGEEVHVEIVQEKKDFCKTIAVAWRVASPYRQRAFCSYFGRCGGCQWQDISYDYQCTLKQEIFAEIMRRAKLGACIPAVQFHPSMPQQTRHRMQLHVHSGQLGLLGRKSHDFVSIKDCPVAAAPIRAFLNNPSFTPNQDKFCVLANTETCYVQGRDKNCRISIMGKGLFTCPELFFQNHLGLLEPFLQAVLGQARGTVAMDLYAGIGLFSAFLQDSFDKVLACEVQPAVGSFFALNAPRVQLTCAPVEQFFKRPLPPADFMVLDPPRQGLSPEVIQYLLEHICPHVVYVSCDPVTQARDLQKLCTQYTIAQAHMFDFYPHTAHMETVLHLLPA